MIDMENNDKSEINNPGIQNICRRLHTVQKGVAHTEIIASLSHASPSHFLHDNTQHIIYPITIRPLCIYPILSFYAQAYTVWR